MAKKVYAVKKGITPGIYYTWDDCKKQVDGFSGAIYKSFTSIEEANSFMMGADIKSNKVTLGETAVAGNKESVAGNKNSGTAFMSEPEGFEDEAIAYVDGSYENNMKMYAYGCVILYNGETVELNGSGNDPDLVEMRNVAGEILGSSYAIKWAIEHGIKAINVHHDYEGIARWANGEWKANKVGTQKYKKYVEGCREVINIRFTKVAAHTGVELNERADYLAKAALGIEG